MEQNVLVGTVVEGDRDVRTPTTTEEMGDDGKDVRVPCDISNEARRTTSVRPRYRGVIDGLDVWRGESGRRDPEGLTENPFPSSCWEQE